MINLHIKVIKKRENIQFVIRNNIYYFSIEVCNTTGTTPTKVLLLFGCLGAAEKYSFDENCRPQLLALSMGSEVTEGLPN